MNGLGDPAILGDQRKMASMARRHKLDAMSPGRELRGAYEDMQSSRDVNDSGSRRPRVMRDEIRPIRVAIAVLDEELKV